MLRFLKGIIVYFIAKLFADTLYLYAGKCACAYSQKDYDMIIDLSKNFSVEQLKIRETVLPIISVCIIVLSVKYLEKK